VATSVTAANFPAFAETNGPAHAAAVSPQFNQLPSLALDHRRKWLWWFLAIAAVSQLYFVREMLAALALFSIAFVAMALVVASVYMLVKCGELAVARLSALRNPAADLTSANHVSPMGNLAPITRRSQNAA
jgi:hypothetical protein